MRKEVMVRAWKIAREAVVNFGGKVVEYLSGALKMAWAEIKKGVDKMKFVKKELNTSEFIDGQLVLATSNRQPAWVAAITGLDAKYGFERSFIQKDEYDEVGPGWFAVEFADGIIVNWSEEKGVHHFGIFEDGQLFNIDKEDVEMLLNAK